VAQAETSPNKSAFALSGASNIASEMPAANRLARPGSITRPSLGLVVVRTVMPVALAIRPAGPRYHRLILNGMPAGTRDAGGVVHVTHPRGHGPGGLFEADAGPP
jgi:hypothetical protein